MHPSTLSSNQSFYSYTPIEATLVPTTTPIKNKSATTNVTEENGNNTDFLYRRPRQLNHRQIQSLVVDKGFTKGLAKSLNQMLEVCALRYWIIDNSGSMQLKDGIIPTIASTSSRTTIQSDGESPVVKMVPCSRWEEILECVDYHMKLADLIGAPTRFRLLNNPGAHVGPQQFSVAESRTVHRSTSPMHHQDVHDATSILKRVVPRGCTPLTRHVLEIRKEILEWTPELLRLGKKVVIVIATDGLPSDEQGYGGPDHNEEFIEALRLLETLPVRVIIRLCTDEEDVVNFYNELNTQLDLSMEILADFVKEAKEVSAHNPWINYALPLHRLREMGYEDPVLDLLDEQPLTRDEIRKLCVLLFGYDEHHTDSLLADPLDWRRFRSDIRRLLAKELPQYDPIARRVHSWINVKRLSRRYGMRWQNSFFRNINNWMDTYDPL